MPVGWIKVGLQVPKSVASGWAGDRARTGQIKLLGTAAISIVASMPEEMQLELMAVVHRNTFPDPNALKAEDVWSRLLELIEQQKA
jgi:hypothetical protein